MFIVRWEKIQAISLSAVSVLLNIFLPYQHHFPLMSLIKYMCGSFYPPIFLVTLLKIWVIVHRVNLCKLTKVLPSWYIFSLHFLEKCCRMWIHPAHRLFLFPTGRGRTSLGMCVDNRNPGHVMAWSSRPLRSTTSISLVRRRENAPKCPLRSNLNWIWFYKFLQFLSWTKCVICILKIFVRLLFCLQLFKDC